MRFLARKFYVQPMIQSFVIIIKFHPVLKKKNLKISITKFCDNVCYPQAKYSSSAHRSILFLYKYVDIWLVPFVPLILIFLFLKWETVQQLLINLTNLCQTKHLYIELNQGTFMFGEYKTRENIRQSNIIFMTIKQYT